MNEYQKRIYNTIIDNIKKGSRMILFMPRSAGKTAIRDALNTCPECQFEKPRYVGEKSAHQKDCSKNFHKEIEKIRKVMNHKYDDCAAHGEGLTCCLDEEHRRAREILSILN